MEGFHAGRELVLVLAGEDLLVGKPAVTDWQKGAVDVRIGFVEMYDEGDDVFLTVFVRNEAVNIPRPLLDVGAAVEMGVIRSVCQIEGLGAEGKLVHAVAGAAEDEVDDGAELGFGEAGVGVFDASGGKDGSHALGDATGLVDGTDLAGTDLEVEVGTGAVVVACGSCGVPALVGPTTLVLVGLGGGDALGGAEVEDLLGKGHDGMLFC